MPVPLEVEAPASLVTEAVVRAVVHVAKLSAEREIHVVSQKEVPAEIGALQHSIGQIVLAELGEGEGLGTYVLAAGCILLTLLSFALQFLAAISI